jgi:FkbM family methyltransferase
MALAKEDYTLREPILTPGTRRFLEHVRYGRLGLHAARKVRRLLWRLRDPAQRKVWIRRFSLPLRNAIFPNRPLSVAIDGVVISLTPRGSVAGDLWTGLPGHTREAAFLLTVLEPGMIFFDVGARAGLFAIAAAKKIGEKGVFAFEPCASTCNLLRRNLALNRLSDTHVEPLGLGEAAGEGILQLNAGADGRAKDIAQSTRSDRPPAAGEKFRVTTLDAFVLERSIPRVDLLRVDVDGAELMVLRGARNLLERPDAPDILYQGYAPRTRGFGYHPVEILWFLESYGYTLFSLEEETGRIARVKSDYPYDSTVIAAKPGGRMHAKLQASLK